MAGDAAISCLCQASLYCPVADVLGALPASRRSLRLLLACRLPGDVAGYLDPRLHVRVEQRDIGGVQVYLVHATLVAEDHCLCGRTACLVVEQLGCYPLSHVSAAFLLLRLDVLGQQVGDSDVAPSQVAAD